MKLDDVRSMLFVPGDRPERFARALASGAQAIIIDWEDAVAPAQKDFARQTVMTYLAQPRTHPSVLVGVRVNNIHTAFGLADLQALATGPHAPDFVALPKVESVFEVLLYERHLRRPGSHAPEFMCAVETARGLQAACDIASACTSVRMIGFGGGDLATDLGAELAWDTMLMARSRIVQAAAYAQIIAVDMPWLALDDETGLIEETERARRLGYRVKLAIHPRQLAAISNTMAPSPAQLAWAQRVVDEFARRGAGVFDLDGKMIDEPIHAAAKRVVASGAAHRQASGPPPLPSPSPSPSQS